MPKEELIEVILGLYDARKEAKEYLEYFLHADSQGEIEKRKKWLHKEFFPRGEGHMPGDYSVVKCKQIISDFEKMKADPVDVADLMLFYVEIGCRFTLAYGDIDEPFYASFARYFDKTMKYIRANNLMSVYRNRAKKIVDSVYDDVGWGFPDELLDSYNKYETK